MAQVERTIREQSSSLAARAESIAGGLSGVVWGIQEAIFGPVPPSSSDAKDSVGGDSLEGDLGRIERALSRIQQTTDQANVVRGRLGRIEADTAASEISSLPRASRF